MPHSDEFADLVNSLLIKDPRDRLQGADNVLNHPWFTNTEHDAYIAIDRIANKLEKPVAPPSFFEYSNTGFFSMKIANNKHRESDVNPEQLEKIKTKKLSWD